MFFQLFRRANQYISWYFLFPTIESWIIAVFIDAVHIRIKVASCNVAGSYLPVFPIVPHVVLSFSGITMGRYPYRKCLFRFWLYPRNTVYFRRYHRCGRRRGINLSVVFYLYSVGYIILQFTDTDLVFTITKSRSEITSIAVAAYYSNSGINVSIIFRHVFG